jgi:SAM-dependent methyltransferase
LPVAYQKFDIAKLERLNDTGRFDDLIPDVLWAAANTPDARTIVEIGAGTGLFACRFAEMAPDAEVYAADIESVMVRWMFQHRPAALSGRLHPILAEETSVPLPTGDADLVVMINVHHELADPRSSYCEALRLLKIGGTLLVADWRPGDTPKGPPQAVRASAEQISEILATVGFCEIAEHEGLPNHTLLTAKKAAVCGTGIRPA